MRKRKEDGEAREKNLEEQLAVETSANQELQVRFFVGRMRKLLWQTAYLNLICYDSILLLSHHWRVQRVQVDWSRNLVTREPMRHNTKTSCRVCTWVFPRLKRRTCIFFEFSLAPVDIDLVLIGSCDNICSTTLSRKALCDATTFAFVKR